MTIKICTKCSEEKDLNKFYTGNTYADGYHNICKLCTKEFRSQTPEAMLDRTYRNRRRNREYVWNYLLEHPCVDCGEGDPFVLEFDHVRGEKYKEITKMAHHTHSIKRIQEEIEKCEVVCSNCHKRRTAKTQKWYKWLESVA